jgi:RNA polymerase sigma-70 factor, ECF subfamily
VTGRFLDSMRRTASRESPEQELVRQLYETHRRVLQAYARRLTGNDRQRGEDLVQETFTRVWQRIDQLPDNPRAVRSWLCTVMRNLFIDQERARQARAKEVGDEMLAIVPKWDDTDQRLQSAEILEALGKLSRPHRDVLVHIYYHGKTVNEAAQVLKVAPGTVKSRTYYALRALRVVLEESGIVG